MKVVALGARLATLEVVALHAASHAVLAQGVGSVCGVAPLLVAVVAVTGAGGLVVGDCEVIISRALGAVCGGGAGADGTFSIALLAPSTV